MDKFARKVEIIRRPLGRRQRRELVQGRERNKDLRVHDQTRHHINSVLIKRSLGPAMQTEALWSQQTIQDGGPGPAPAEAVAWTGDARHHQEETWFLVGGFRARGPELRAGGHKRSARFRPRFLEIWKDCFLPSKFMRFFHRQILIIRYFENASPRIQISFRCVFWRGSIKKAPDQILVKKILEKGFYRALFVRAMGLWR